jgi:hypothetical protein
MSHVEEKSPLRFRIVSLIPPVRKDFLSTYEDNVGRGISKDFGDAFWQACGTSMHRDLEGARKTRQRYKRLRPMKIATGVLLPPMGKMKPTPGPDGHITVWFKISAEPQKAFVTDAEGSS